MPMSVEQRVGFRERGFPPELLNRLTDMLADLVLEDLEQYPGPQVARPIDTFGRQVNTSRVTQKG
ncbi:MAG: hypothetical protein ABI955_00770 [Nitrospirota bacterium]